MTAEEAQAELLRTADLRGQLTTLVPLLLREAEARFGPRLDPTWAFSGVFLRDGPSQVQRGPFGVKAAAIIISRETEGDPDQMLHHLAHEVVHLLCLGRSTGVPMLEEGAAVHFSLTAPIFSDAGYAAEVRTELESNPLAAHYVEALGSYEALIAIDPLAMSKARAVEPDFGRITPDLLQSVAPGLTAETAVVLCEARDMLEMWRATQCEPSGNDGAGRNL